MDSFPKLISGPDDMEGSSWVEVRNDPNEGFVATIPSDGLTRPHPNRRALLEEMVRRYNAHDYMVDQIEGAVEYFKNIQERDGDTNHAAIAGFMRGCLRNALQEANND